MGRRLHAYHELDPGRYSWAMRARAIIENGGIDGIILVDEIEQHIHPSMQMGLLGVLSTFWPAAQIFATTHSPLTALGAQPEELVVLKRSSSGIELVKDPPDFTGYSVLEMLTDNRLFGSPGFRPEVKAQIEAYSSLSAKPKAERTKAESKELLQVSRKLMDAELSKPAHTPLLRQLNELLARHNL